MGGILNTSISRRGVFSAALGLAATGALSLVAPRVAHALPESDEWFDEKSAYVRGLLNKVELYDSATDFFCCVDTDLTRTIIFERMEGEWNAIAGYNCFCGINQPWRSYEYGGYHFSNKDTWSGPRSRSFKGAFRIVGRFAEQGGSQFVTCYVECNHGYETDDCQRFEFTGYGNPNDCPQDQRYKTQGCAAQSYDVAQWIFEVVPDGTTVLVFDEVNPRPGWVPENASDMATGGAVADYFSYTVQHRSLVDDELLYEEEYYGVVDQPTQAEPMEFEGLELREFEQEPISDDGSCVVVIPYGVPDYKNTPYRVEHRDVLAGTVWVTQTKTGVVGEETKAEALEIKGYKARPIEQQIIAEDGSTTIIVKYDQHISMFDIKNSS